jgi:hypothetical protein
VLFVTELLQRLRNGQVNEKEPRRNRSRQSEIDLPSHIASAWQAIGDSAKHGMPRVHRGASKPSNQEGRVTHASYAVYDGHTRMPEVRGIYSRAYKQPSVLVK